MRIGILTYHCVPNFGAQLQAASTVGYLKKHGHEPFVLHWYPEELEQMYAQRISQEQIDCHEKFTEEILPTTSLCRTVEQLVKIVDNLALDGIIAGSDALFKYSPLAFRNDIRRKIAARLFGRQYHWDKLEGNPFFGGFAHELKRPVPMCAFSVSSQNCPYQLLDSNEILKLKEALSAYSFISLRDEWTKQMVSHIMQKESYPITPDPVFSFNANLHFNLPEKEELLEKFNLPENYILLSFSKHFATDDYLRSLSAEFSSRGLCPVSFPMPEALRIIPETKHIPLPLSPSDWYALIKHSHAYVGERMHPVVVALHNAVPLFSFDEYGTYRRSLFGKKKAFELKSSKTWLVLSEAGLSEHFYSYNSGHSLPTPATVADSIAKFDKSKCLAFSNLQQQRYENGMKALLESMTANSNNTTR